MSEVQTARMQAAIRDAIRAIPRGKVATYGQVAAAAGYPRGHRQVAQVLRSSPSESLPWQRVVGAGGAIKTHLESALEQRFRLEMEGVKFRGSRVDLAAHQSPLHFEANVAAKRIPKRAVKRKASAKAATRARGLRR